MVKSHGMSSEKASRIKTRGENKEYLFAALINGQVNGGTRKTDVTNSHNQLFTIKGGSEIKNKEGRDGKWQIFLHKLSKFESDLSFPHRETFIKILKSYPLNYSDYENDKKQYKEKIIPHMVNLKKEVNNNSISLLDKSFFDNKIDFLVIYDDEIFHIFDRKDVLETFKQFEKDNNKSFQKVVFKHNNKICAEIEVRTTNDGKYPSILFCMQKRITLDLLIEKIEEVKTINKNLKTYGLAVTNFKY